MSSERHDQNASRRGLIAFITRHAWELAMASDATAGLVGIGHLGQASLLAEHLRTSIDSPAENGPVASGLDVSTGSPHTGLAMA